MSDLIFDVGMHIGDDTEFYLEKGFRVVAVEANASLVEHAQSRFSDAIRDGRLIIENVAVSEKEDVTFYIHLEKSDWSSTNEQLGKRNQKEAYEVNVKGADMARLFEKYGTPYYCKIDIEGADILAIEQISKSTLRPKYVSLETSDVTCLFKFREMGYKRFKIVNQGNYWWWSVPNPPLEGIYVEKKGFSIHSSGPFGEEASGKWLSFDEACALMLQMNKLSEENDKLIYYWADVHTSL